MGRTECLLIIFSTEKRAKSLDFSGCMKDTSGSAESRSVGDADVGIGAARLRFYRYWNPLVSGYTAGAAAQIHTCKHWGGKVESKHTSL